MLGPWERRTRGLAGGRSEGDVELVSPVVEAHVNGTKGGAIESVLDFLPRAEGSLGNQDSGENTSGGAVIARGGRAVVVGDGPLATSTLGDDAALPVGGGRVLGGNGECHALRIDQESP
jgi:hypothetical protein